ncbi:hypothetical protein ABT282_07400 [Streptomyces sp. NPDC000927]|uniref:hypothetical protein n=1 Tax=Streptomyces sp. NPDC000927 TaxID=3154371 RepID=UPI0033311615
MLRDGNGNRITIGHVLPGSLGASVMYVTEYGTTETVGGVVLAYSAHKREYWVWTVNGSTGELSDGVYRYGMQDALNIFFDRSMAHGFRYTNLVPPTCTYGDKNPE